MQTREAAQALLGAFVEQLEAQGVTLPERRYVAPGALPVWDGPQLVINLQELLRGQPGVPVEQSGWPVPTVLAARFGISLVRLVPALHDDGPLGAMIPEATEIGVSGDEAMQDADALVEAALAIQQADTITEPGMGFAIGPCTPLGPQGGMAGVTLRLTISLD